MVKEIIIKYEDSQFIIDPSSQDGQKILEKVNDILPQVVQVRMVFVGKEIYEARNSSSYIEVILNKKYEFNIYDDRVNTDKLIIFVFGKYEHIITIFGGMDSHNREVWNCYSIYSKHPSFLELKNLVKDLAKVYR